MNVNDVRREFAKAENVLGLVETYLTAYNQSMAALHLSPTVLPSPLTSAVMQARNDLRLASDRVAAEGA